MKRFHRSGTNRQATSLNPEFTRRTGVIRSSIPTWHSDDSSVVPSSVTKQPSSRRFKHGCVKRRSSFFHRFLSARKLHCSFITPFCNRPSGIYILTGSASFPPGFPFLFGRCFAFFKHTQVPSWVCKIRTEEATNWTGKIKISLGTGMAKFSLCEGKNSTGSAIEGCFILLNHILKTPKDQNSLKAETQWS